MAKILEFKRVKQEAKMRHEPVLESEDFEEDINAIMHDYTLSPTNRRYLLENMLMNIDDQLEEYKRDLEVAERKLESVVSAAEKEIEDAYREFDQHVRGMTSAVKKLTKRRSRSRSAEAVVEEADSKAGPK